MIVYTHRLADRLINGEGVLMAGAYEVLGFKLRSFPSYHPGKIEDEELLKLWEEEEWVQMHFWNAIFQGGKKLFTLKVNRNYAPIVTQKGKSMAVSLDRKILSRIVRYPRLEAQVVPLKDNEIMFRVLRRMQGAGASHISFFITPNVNEELPITSVWSIIQAENLGEIPDAIALSQGTAS